MNKPKFKKGDRVKWTGSKIKWTGVVKETHFRSCWVICDQDKTLCGLMNHQMTLIKKRSNKQKKYMNEIFWLMKSASLDWQPTQWTLKDSDEISPITINLVGSPTGNRYAIRRGPYCLNKKGKWEYEPIPSSRTDAFFKRCRFATFVNALLAFKKADSL